MIGLFDISEKVHLYEDKKEFFEYSYSGVVQLVNKKVFVTFNGGQCRKYVKGGSGGEGYNYSGASRNGANLIAILSATEYHLS